MVKFLKNWVECNTNLPIYPETIFHLVIFIDIIQWIKRFSSFLCLQYNKRTVLLEVSYNQWTITEMGQVSIIERMSAGNI